MGAAEPQYRARLMTGAALELPLPDGRVASRGMSHDPANLVSSTVTDPFSFLHECPDEREVGRRRLRHDPEYRGGQSRRQKGLRSQVARVVLPCRPVPERPPPVSRAGDG